MGTGNAGNISKWVDVSNSAVTPVDGDEWTFRFTFDYGAKRFSVAVIDGERKYPLKAAGGERSFPLAADGNAISEIAFDGETQFSSLLGKCGDGIGALPFSGMAVIIK